MKSDVESIDIPDNKLFRIAFHFAWEDLTLKDAVRKVYKKEMEAAKVYFFLSRIMSIDISTARQNPMVYEMKQKWDFAIAGKAQALLDSASKRKSSRDRLADINTAKFYINQVQDTAKSIGQNKIGIDSISVGMDKAKSLDDIMKADIKELPSP